MTIPQLFRQYIWLIETLDRHGKLTFAEISDLWERSQEGDGAPLSRTTFNRHRGAVLDMFGIIIECDRRDGNRYYIENREELREDTVQNWLYSTMSVSNMLESNVALHSRIVLESVPKGGEHLQLIIKAMRESRCVMITYRRYRAKQASSFTAEPYCLKLFRRRWYLLVRFADSRGFTILSLDRVLSLAVLETRFAMDPEFRAADFFSDYYGVVIGDDSPAERIVLRAHGMEPYYLRDLPLHHSQRELTATDDYADFELTLRPTNDFLAHLLSRGAWLQVLEPQWLAQEMRRRHQEAIERYD